MRLFPCGYGSSLVPPPRANNTQNAHSSHSFVECIERALLGAERLTVGGCTHIASRVQNDRVRCCWFQRKNYAPGVVTDVRFSGVLHVWLLQGCCCRLDLVLLAVLLWLLQTLQLLLLQVLLLLLLQVLLLWLLQVLLLWLLQVLLLWLLQGLLLWLLQTLLLLLQVSMLLLLQVFMLLLQVLLWTRRS